MLFFGYAIRELPLNQLPVFLGEGYYIMKEIHELVRSMGIHATYKGYNYIVHALCLTQEDERRLLYITKQLYPLIAAEFDTNVQCVERNIRTVINSCWKEQRELVQEACPYTLKLRPSTSEFLDILYWNLTSKQA